MARVVNPFSEYVRERNLLIPGRKPVGNVKIDWENPLSRDLVLCLSYADGSRRPKKSDGGLYWDRTSTKAIDLVNGYTMHGAFVGEYGTEVPSTGFYFDGTNKQYNMLFASDLGWTSKGAVSKPRTIAVRFKAGSVSGEQMIVGTNTSGFTFGQYGMGIGLNGTSLSAIGGAGSVNTISTTISSNTWYTAIARFSSSGALVVNGVIKATGDIGYEWEYKFAIGAAVATASPETTEGRNFTGYIEFVHAWDRGLSDAEMCSFCKDPYQILTPA